MAEKYASGTTPMPTDPMRVIEQKILTALNNGAGGGGSGAPDSINYAGPPLVNPPALQNIIVDVNGQQWQFFNNQWN